MLKRELNKLKMFRATISFLKSNEDKVAKIVEFENSFRSFAEKVTEIEGIDSDFMGGLKAETLMKRRKREILVNSARVCAIVFYVAGVRNNISELKVNLKLSKTALRLMTDAGLIERCKMILNLAGKYQYLLEGKGLNGEKAEKLRESVSDFENAIEKQNLKRSKLRADREKLSELFKETSRILKEEIDRFMFLYKKDTEFYEGYLSVRKIVG